MASVKLVKTIPPTPEAKRGYGLPVTTSSKHGDEILYGSGKIVVVRSLADPSESKIFSDHKSKVTVAKVSPSGFLVASGDDEGKVIVWELGKEVFGKVRSTIPVNSAVLDLDWSPDSKKIIAVGAGEPVKAKVFSFDSGNTTGKIEMHGKPILSVSYRQAKPERIATCAEDLAVNFYEGPPFKFMKTIKDDFQRYPSTIRYSPDGNLVIAVGQDSKIAVFDGKTGDKVKEIVDKKEGHTAAIYSFSWSPDSKQIITSAADKTAKLWDVESGAVVKTFKWIAKPETGDMLMSTFWHKGAAEYVGVVSLSGAITILDLDKPDTPKAIYQGLAAPAQSLTVARDLGLVFAPSSDAQITKYDIKTFNGSWFTGKGHGKTVSGTAVAGDKLVSIGFDDKLRINDIKSGEYSSESISLGGKPVSLAVGKKDPTLIVVALSQNKLVQISKGAIVKTVDLGFEPLSVDISNDDSEIAVGGKDKKVHIFDSKLGAGAIYSESQHPVSFVSYQPGDSKLLAVVDGNKNLFFYSEGKNLNPLGWNYHTGSVVAAWSPSGKRYATASQDQSIIVWSDFVSFKPDTRITIKDAHIGGVDHVGWLDENTIISVGADKTIRLWSLA